jgi:hypothetical protein
VEVFSDVDTLLPSGFVVSFFLPGRIEDIGTTRDFYKKEIVPVSFKKTRVCFNGIIDRCHSL